MITQSQKQRPHNNSSPSNNASADGPSHRRVSFRLAVPDDDVDLIGQIVNEAYRIGEQGIIAHSKHMPFYRATKPEIQDMLATRSLLLLLIGEGPTPRSSDEITNNKASVNGGADDRGLIVGCIKVQSRVINDPNDPGFGKWCGELGCLAVSIDQQGKGFGHLLIQAAESHLKNELNCQLAQIDLLVPTHGQHQHKERLRRWYTERLGYDLKFPGDYRSSSELISFGTMFAGKYLIVSDSDYVLFRKALA